MIEIDCNELRGWGSVCIADTSAGVNIYRCTPVAHCLSASHLSLHCSGCIKGEGVTLSRCSGCKKVYYCSSQCQRDDWYYHKMECAQMVVGEKRLTTTMRIVSYLLAIFYLSITLTQDWSSTQLAL